MNNELIRNYWNAIQMALLSKNNMEFRLRLIDISFIRTKYEYRQQKTILLPHYNLIKEKNLPVWGKQL